LHQASINGREEIVRLLIDCGADLDLKDLNGMRPLHYACLNGKLEIVNILLRNGANPNEPSFGTNETPLHFAIQFNSNSDLSEKLINCLLINGASLSLCIQSKKYEQSPFELACELGKIKLVELIINYCLNENKNDNKKLDEFLKNYSPNAVHLASKNGHDDIVRVLLINNLCDLNKVSSMCNGTPLHEACRYGRFQTVKLLLESGCDASLTNTTGQTAIDVCIKQKVSNDIKFLIKEYSQAVYGISIEPHLNSHAGSLWFGKNELITIIDRNNLNTWRGYILNRQTYTTEYGYFPSTHVRLISRKFLKPFATSSTSSLVLNNLKFDDDLSSIMESESNHLSDDQQLNTINSNATKTMSKDSIYSQVRKGFYGLQSFNNNLNGNQSVSPSSISASSSCSFNQSQSTTQTNVGDLLRNGQNESEIIFNWLKECCLQQYYENFVQSGYDLMTITKATPADLSAIGISDPTHRNTLKNYMKRFDLRELDDRLTTYLKNVNSIDDLLKLIHLEQYSTRINELKLYKNFTEFINCLIWEDMEEIGIKKLGHQKKLMLVTKRVKDILNESNQTTIPPTNESLNDNVSMSRQITNDIAHTKNTSICSPLKRENLIVNLNKTNSNHLTKPSFQPPVIPPRISSSISNYATLPRNNRNGNKLTLESNNDKVKSDALIDRPISASSQTSSSISPQSSSPTSTNSASSAAFGVQEKFIHETQLFPAPPPMPLISMPSIIPPMNNNNMNKSNFAISKLENLNKTKSSTTKTSALGFSNPLKFSSVQRSTSINNNDMLKNINENFRFNFNENRLLDESRPIFLKTNTNLAENPFNNLNDSNRRTTLSNPKPKLTTNTTASDKNVLKDIDSMLLDLNKQLDEMLEFEKIYQ